MITLLDVNVLVALAWPNHSHHASAHLWFGNRTTGWATTAITEAGFVRVSSNQRALATAVRPIDALALLSRLRAVSGHSFWVDDVENVVNEDVEPTRILGHQQIADAHLIALAIARGGTVATFDRGLRNLVDKKLARHITLVDP